ncbi:MAG: hypothetical protein GWM98_04045 [Nitrospinaceae bacterium]|nr:hypothetical protein [Nitrospinaceae bacterium]NIR53828.1 hypothetical protein [Nitrospinaceae bacterium]NIS84239.1 hypothetical protein [Nitrospinaceae bacterium]NIT81043.1 hypothetical protein [Nitrospinaceae bacterium]NIU43334.1 hypothetical protein [Nitrospinaceae bacterium]
MAVLISVIITLIIMAVIALNFLVDTENKQYGATLSASSTQALMAAESGIRYTEKCLLANDVNCPFSPSPADWTVPPAGFTKTFGSGNGNFTISFTGVTTDSLVVTSVGTFGGSSRQLSKTVTQAVCKLPVNAVTSCVAATIGANTTITGTVESLYCPATPLVDALVFPGGGCTAYPGGSFTLNGPTENLCSWDQTANGEVVTINGPTTVWVPGNFTMRRATTIIINGDVTLNVGGNVQMRNTADIQVNGTLTLQVDNTLSMSNQAMINNTTGDPADVLVLAMGNVTMTDDTLLNGAVITNSTLTLRKDAVVTGALLGNDVRVRDRAMVTHDTDAGVNSGAYGECTP